MRSAIGQPAESATTEGGSLRDSRRRITQIDGAKAWLSPWYVTID